MKGWSPQQVARAAGARLLSPPPTEVGPERATIDSGDAGPGALFVGLQGANVHGGSFGPQALAAGAWGVLTAPEHAEAARCGLPGVLLAAEDPLRALQRLATAWRRELGAQVIGVTGSTGKTTTKELIFGLLAPHRRTVASRANFNTEIGLPLEILGAPMGTEVLVLEMGMRGVGQIAELGRVAEPDVAVIVSIGPVHLELLETVEAVATAKAELIAALAPGGSAVVPADEDRLVPYLRADVETVRFGAGGDVRLCRVEPASAGATRVEIELAAELIVLEVSFTQAHLHRNLLAAVAAARAVGVSPGGRLELALSGRGQRVALPEGMMLIDDCYNANPMSMRAALEDLEATATRGGEGRRVAILGDMLELGPGARAFHAELGDQANANGVDVLVTVGPQAAAIAEAFAGEAHVVADATEAAAIVPELLEAGDVILVKASRGVGLELVCQTLAAGAPA